uniref:Uncharacterized protein LOC105851200 n=1 Tax=Cicer arietinum TaxID=3827 RepID=A0A1S3DUT6_CICAR|nr:uncharacterized protein LOC105851200 [Cicer arietinum]
MTSKENIRLKLPFKTNRIILPPKVTQAAQQVQATVDQLPLDVNATTPTSHYVRHPTQQLVQPPTQQAAVLPIQPNKVHGTEPIIVMMPTPNFVPEDNISPIADHSPSQPLTFVASRHTSISANPPHSTHVAIGNKTQGSRCSNSSHGVAPDGRTMIWPNGRGWLPCRVASRALTLVITLQYVDPYPSWGAIPKLTLEPRKKRKCPTWMRETVWDDLEKIWMDPSYKEISNRAKKNRASFKGGVVHTGGSISIVEHTIRMAEELGRDLTLDEAFLKTHTKKKDNSWVDERAKKTYLQQAFKGGKASSSCSQVVNAKAHLDMWVQSVGGKNKGRIYGAGHRSSLYRSGVASLVPDSRPSRGCANFLSQQSNEIAAQIAAFEERAKAAEHEGSYAESSCRRRHLDYDEDESSDDDGEK